MDSVNINMLAQPEPPPRRWSYALLYVLIGVLLALIVEAIILLALRGQGRALGITVTGPAATQTARVQAAMAATATPTTTATVAPSPAAATATPRGNGQATPTSTPTISHAPTNPTTMQVRQGSCRRQSMAWRWSGATGATGYDVALYNPNSGAILARNTTLESRFTQVAAPGQSFALKVRARNNTGTAPDYFTPSDTAHVPPLTTNPTAIQVATTTTTLTWTWSGARSASGYDVALYHYAGPRVAIDTNTTVNAPRFTAPAHGNTTYYLKVRSLGPCGPGAFFTPGVASAARA